MKFVYVKDFSYTIHKEIPLSKASHAFSVLYPLKRKRLYVCINNAGLEIDVDLLTLGFQQINGAADGCDNARLYLIAKKQGRLKYSFCAPEK